MRGSISASNECLMGKRGSTPTVRNGGNGRHPTITRTASVGLYLDPKNGSLQRLNGFTEFGSNPSLYPGSTGSMDRLALERTSSLGKLTENKPYHNMTMKTISETQLGGGMFSDEELASNQGGEPHATDQELCSIDESLTSDDCSTQGSDTPISNTEIIDAAATAINKSASTSLKLENPLTKNLSPPKSPNISPLHHKLQSSLSTESREGSLPGASVSPIHLATPGNSPSHLKSILRSPSNSITSLSSISPTHTSFHTPPMPSTPTSVPADRAHSTLLLGGSTAAHSHTIVPTSSSNDTSKNEKSPSPSPSMDLEVVTCKTVVDEGQSLLPKRELHSRSNSDTSVDSINKGGLQFHVTFVNDGNARNSNISTLIEEESTSRTMSPALLSPNDQAGMLILRQSSDSMLMSPRQINNRPHKVMFAECTQILSFDSESDIDDKITIIKDDLSVLDLSNPESETPVNGHTTSEVNGLPESPSDKSSQVSDNIESALESYGSQPPHATTVPSSSAIADLSPRVEKEDMNEKQTHIKQSAKVEKPAKVPPAHRRVTGKGVRALSQMFEENASPSSTPPPPVRSIVTSPTHQSNRRVSVSKIPISCESPILGSPRLTRNHPNETKSSATRNNTKSSKVGGTPTKTPLKSTKGASASAIGKQRSSHTEKVASTPDQSPTITKRGTPARKNSVYQQRTAAGASTKPNTSSATRRVSRVDHGSPAAGIPRHTSSPSVSASKKQPPSKAPVTKPKPTRSQALSAGKEHPNPMGSPKHVRASRDSTTPRSSKLQRQPSVASSRSPSPYSSSAQGGHKPLSRLSGTRQPLRRKSNNSSPAEIRKNHQHLKPVADGLNSNCNNNNNSSFDEDERMMDSFALSGHFTDGSFISPRRNKSVPPPFPNSLQKTVRFSVGSSSNEGSLESLDKDSHHSQARGESSLPDQATVSSRSAAHELQPDDRNHQLKLKVDELFRHHHSLPSSCLRHARKRSPHEWEHFGLSWKQSSFPQIGQVGLSQSRVLTNSRTTIS